MGVYNSKNGKIEWEPSAGGGFTAVPHARGWRFNEEAETAPYSSSDTSCRKKRTVGNLDGTGSFDVYHDDEKPLELDMEGDSSDDVQINAGDKGTLRLYVNATKFWVVPAVIKSFEIGNEIEDASNEAVAVQFEFDGAPTKPDWTP